jgi:hypothetical protein
VIRPRERSYGETSTAAESPVSATAGHDGAVRLSGARAGQMVAFPGSPTNRAGPTRATHCTKRAPPSLPLEHVPVLDDLAMLDMVLATSESISH